MRFPATAWIALPLAALALSSGAEDPPAPETETHGCPFCHQDIEVPNTPAGAWMKVKIGVATGDRALLRVYLLGYDPDRSDAAGAARVFNAQLMKVEEKGDSAVLVMQLGEGVVELPAVKQEGVWKVDVRAIVEQQRLGECRAHLQQIGDRIRKYVQAKKRYPRSGEDLWTDLREAGLLEIRLVNCPGDPTRVSPADFEGDHWAVVSYRVTRDALGAGANARKPVVWEKTPAHPGRRVVLTAAGNVFDMTQEQFDEAIETFEGAPPDRESGSK